MPASVYKLDCASRSAARPFTPSGAPVEYVHVPKSGGTSIQHMLTSIARAQRLVTQRRDFGQYLGGRGRNASSSPPVLASGTVYDGHEPLGWGAMPSSSALTMVSWRESHISLILSMYSYKAAQRLAPTGVYLREAEARLERAGVAPESMFDSLLRQDDPVACGIAQTRSSSFLLPRSCSPTALNVSEAALKEASLSIKLKNLAAINIVVVTDRLGVQLPVQLRWHAPWVKVPAEVHDNGRTRPAQNLSEGVRSRLARHAGQHDGQRCWRGRALEEEERLSGFAARVAEARTAHAAACLRRSRSGPCPVACQINVSAAEEALLNRTIPTEWTASCLQRGTAPRMRRSFVTGPHAPGASLARPTRST